jgi:hypothetical protein
VLRAAAASRWLPWIALAAVMAAAVVLIMYAGRGTTFFYDDWPVILERRDWTLDALLRPHVDHLQLFPTLAYKLMLETIGMHAHWAYRALLAALNVLTGVLLFAYARRRVSPWIGLGLAACLVVMADSWYNIIYSFQINFVGAMAAGVGMLLALDRRDRLGDALACALLTIAIACNSVALPFLAAAAIEVLWRPGRWRRLWVPGVPLVLYGAWRAVYSDRLSDTAWQNVQAIPMWIMDGLDDSVAAMVGVSGEYSATLAIALVAFVAWTAMRPGGLHPRLAALIAMPIVFWSLSAIGRSNMGIQADENRYLYASALMLALLAVEAGRGWRLPGRAVAVVTGLLLLGAAASANELEDGGNRLRQWSGTGKNAVTAYDIAGHLRPDDWSGSADPTQGFLRLDLYRQAVFDYAPSPAFTRPELLREPAGRKLGVDDALIIVHGIGVVPVAGDTRPGAAPPSVLWTEHGQAEPPRRGCVRYVPANEGAALVAEMPWTGILVRAGDAAVQLRVHRFSTLWQEAPIGEVAPGTVGRVEPLGPDREPERFQAQLKSTAPFEVCTDR